MTCFKNPVKHLAFIACGLKCISLACQPLLHWCHLRCLPQSRVISEALDYSTDFAELARASFVFFI